MGIPLPQSLYSSPFSRALNTAKITFTSIPPLSASASSSPSSKLPSVLIVENVREVNGEHTCDRRETLSYINRTYVDPESRGREEPEFIVEDGFIEEDELWTEERETDEHVRERVIDVLDRIFMHDPARCESASFACIFLWAHAVDVVTVHLVGTG